MRVFAPGKIVMAGAYAVLEGSPSLVVGTTLGAIADGARMATIVTPEVRAALGNAPAPHVDPSQLFAGDRKLGLGASAAILVSSLAVREAERGADLSSDETRARIFDRARHAHADAQAGGSGIDVAGALWGGVLEYTMGKAPVRRALPKGSVLRIFACQNSARTTELRAQVGRLSADQPSVYRARMSALDTAARRACAAVASDSLADLASAIASAAEGLDALGRDSGAPIVPTGFDVLSREASHAGGAFCVGGAGGGDVALYLGPSPPSAAFLAHAQSLGLFLLDASVDEKGVRVMAAATSVAQPLSTPTTP